MIAALLRRLAGGRPAARPAPGRFVPGVTTLEGRDVPSAVTVPLQETLTQTGIGPGPILHFTGQASHLGRVTSDVNALDGTFVKRAATGDTLVGYLTHTNADGTTGTVTYTGGTGRLAGTTGQATYVSTDGFASVTVTGTLSLNQPAAPVTQGGAFRVTGTGDVPNGLPLVPGWSGDHTITDGTATHLGRYTGTGTFTLGSLNINPTTGAVTGTFSGFFGFVAANGDVLTFTYGAGNIGTFSGWLSADGSAVEGVVFDAIFAYDASRSTGRFANLSGGSFRMIAEADSVRLVPNSPYTAPFVYSWAGEGTIDFGTPKKK